jgi:hypothetical protein
MLSRIVDERRKESPERGIPERRDQNGQRVNITICARFHSDWIWISQRRPFLSLIMSNAQVEGDIHGRCSLPETLAMKS